MQIISFFEILSILILFYFWLTKRFISIWFVRKRQLRTAQFIYSWKTKRREVNLIGLLYIEYRSYLYAKKHIEVN